MCGYHTRGNGHGHRTLALHGSGYTFECRVNQGTENYGMAQYRASLVIKRFIFNFWSSLQKRIHAPNTAVTKIYVTLRSRDERGERGPAKGTQMFVRLVVHSLLEGGQRFILHVVTAAAAEPVGVGRVGVADGGVHRAVDAGGGGALAVALGLRDHLPNW